MKKPLYEYRGFAMHDARMSLGTPDGIEQYFREGYLSLDWEDGSYAFPFIYNKKKNICLFGDSGDTHRELFDRPGDDEKTRDDMELSSLLDTHQLRYTGSFYDDDFKQNVAEWQKDNKKMLDTFCEGRIWYVGDVESSLQYYSEWWDEDGEERKKYPTVDDYKGATAYIIFWNDITPSRFKEYCDGIVKQFNTFQKKVGYGFAPIRKYVAVDNNGKPVVFDVRKASTVKIARRSKDRSAEVGRIWMNHSGIDPMARLMKMAQTEKFRQDRDAENQERQYNKTASKTAAEWNDKKALRYNRYTGRMEWGEKLGESIIKGISKALKPLFE